MRDLSIGEWEVHQYGIALEVDNLISIKIASDIRPVECRRHIGIKIA